MAVGSIKSVFLCDYGKLSCFTREELNVQVSKMPYFTRRTADFMSLRCLLVEVGCGVSGSCRKYSENFRIGMVG